MTSATSMPSADSTPACRGTITVADLEPLGDLARVHAAGAAERDEREIARVVPALDRDDANRALHVGVGDAHDAFGERRHAELQRARDVGGDARRARSTSSVIRPPRKYSGSSRPSSRLASVTVSSVPVP